MAWFIEETGDEDFGFSWNLFKQDGENIKCMATCHDETFSKQLKSALEWQDALGSGMMKLAQDGIVIDVNTGKQWVAPKRTRTPKLTITKARRKA